MGGGGILFLNHVRDVGSGSLACTVEEVLASLDNFSSGRQRAILGRRGELIDTKSGRANGVDGDLGDDQVSVEKVFMLADRCNPAESDRIAATGQGALPESLLPEGVLEGLVILSCRRGVWIGGVLRQSKHGQKKEREDEKWFHDFPSVMW